MDKPSPTRCNGCLQDFDTKERLDFHQRYDVECSND